MKKIIKYLIYIGVLLTFFINLDKITDYVADLLADDPKIIIPKKNKYYKNVSYNYVKETDDFIPYSYQDLLNIFYSIFNNGYEVFTFYCPDEYKECLDDTKKIVKDKTTLTYINNFVHPYNNFQDIDVIGSKTGEVNIKITKLYDNKEIEETNKKIDEIVSKIITDEMSLEDKILAIHDYIVNNTKYDQDRAQGKSNYKSNLAYGALIEGYAVCGGYADAMALFLNKLDVPNYKVASLTHVWNAVKINDTWLHIDLTWDDPVDLKHGTDTIIHKFFLIDTDKLESYKIENHEFDKSIYSELS